MNVGKIKLTKWYHSMDSNYTMRYDNNPDEDHPVLVYIKLDDNMKQSYVYFQGKLKAIKLYFVSNTIDIIGLLIDKNNLNTNLDAGILIQGDLEFSKDYVDKFLVKMNKLKAFI